MTKQEFTETFARIRGVEPNKKEYTPEDMTFAYVKGYERAIDIACKVLEGAVMYRKSLFGRTETRVFDDDFIKNFRETTKIE